MDEQEPQGPDPQSVFIGAAKLMHTGKYSRDDVNKWVAAHLPSIHSQVDENDPQRDTPFKALASLLQSKE
jgi:hypothetical protein